MPKLGYYDRGDWNAQCDECGRGFKFSALRLRWDKAWVCSACWEPRQPQDFQRGIKDDPSVPIARPRIFPGVSLPFLWTAYDGSLFTWYTATGIIFTWTN